MNELIKDFANYSEFKQSLDKELKANVEGFVRIGYLLKVARDTDILRESGHKNVADFAAAEYGLTKDVVSRYIAINDRYSENGYSDRLQTKFEGFGVSKLQEMLTLPDSIIEEITPTLTKQEILSIKQEVKAEEEISPIEVAIEAAAPEVQAEEKELTFPLRVWKQYFSADASEMERENFKSLECPFFDSILTDAAETKTAKEKFFDVFGGRIVWARVPGIGRIMISVSDQSEDRIVFTNSRTGEKQEFKSLDVLNDIKDLIDARGCTSEVFDELFREKKEEPKQEAPKEEPKEEPKTAEPEKAEVAPVQQPEEDFMPKPGTEENAQHEAEIVQPKTENAQEEVKNVQEDVKNAQPAPKNAQMEKNEMLGELQVGDRIINIKDGTAGTMLGYCAGEYKISTDNGLTLVNERSTNWRKDKENEDDRDTENRTGAEESKTKTNESDRPEVDTVVPPETEQAGTEDTELADDKRFKDTVGYIKDKADTISIICDELLNNAYKLSDVYKSLETVQNLSEAIKKLVRVYFGYGEGIGDGDDQGII